MTSNAKTLSFLVLESHVLNMQLYRRKFLFSGIAKHIPATFFMEEKKAFFVWEIQSCQARLLFTPPPPPPPTRSYFFVAAYLPVDLSNKRGAERIRKTMSLQRAALTVLSQSLLVPSRKSFGSDVFSNSSFRVSRTQGCGGRGRSRRHRRERQKKFGAEDADR